MDHDPVSYRDTVREGTELLDWKHDDLLDKQLIKGIFDKQRIYNRIPPLIELEQL